MSAPGQAQIPDVIPPPRPPPPPEPPVEEPERDEPNEPDYKPPLVPPLPVLNHRWTKGALPPPAVQTIYVPAESLIYICDRRF